MLWLQNHSWNTHVFCVWECLVDPLFYNFTVKLPSLCLKSIRRCNIIVVKNVTFSFIFCLRCGKFVSFGQIDFEGRISFLILDELLQFLFVLHYELLTNKPTEHNILYVSPADFNLLTADVKSINWAFLFLFPRYCSGANFQNRLTHITVILSWNKKVRLDQLSHWENSLAAFFKFFNWVCKSLLFFDDWESRKVNVFTAKIFMK